MTGNMAMPPAPPVSNTPSSNIQESGVPPEKRGCEEDMISIRGKIVSGLGAAKDTLKAQMPYFVGIFPEIRDCHPASINVELEDALRIYNPDLVTPPIPWAGVPGEEFSFLRVIF